MGRLQVVFTILSVLASLSLADVSSSRVVRPEPTKGSSREESTSRAAVPWGYGKAPLGFEANRGQSDAAVDFIARGPGYALFLTANGAVLSLRKGAPAGVRRTPLGLPGEEAATAIALRLRFIGGRDATGTGRSELSGRANYFAGNDPARWRTNIPTYAKVVYEDVYPGIDLAYYGAQGQLE